MKTYLLKIGISPITHHYNYVEITLMIEYLVLGRKKSFINYIKMIN